MAIEVVSLDSGRTLAARVNMARGPLRRARGLLGRPGLDPGEGLWLDPCRQVHTWFMRFAIDVLFLDRDLVVVGVCRRLAPFRLSPLYWRARSALEIAADAAEGVAPGHRLGMLTRDEGR